MAVYQFSALSDGQAISFDPNTDVLNFDQIAIAAADVLAVADGSNLRISVGDKDVVLLNVVPFQVTTSNITFADGSRLLFGDNTTGTTNDNLANSFSGTAGRDHLAGFGGADTLNGGAGNDVYFVTAGDVIVDSGGIDTIFAETSFALPSSIENITYTGTANTNSAGNSLANVMTGNSGNNRMEGRGGNDTLIGGAGIDVLLGGDGNDFIAGGTGHDGLTGGAGQDIFLIADIETSPMGPDAIFDFVSGLDKILVDAAVFTEIGSAGNFAEGDARFYAAPGATSGHDADDRIIFDISNNGFLYYDPDGSGPAAAQHIASLPNGVVLSATDIAVINGSSGSGVHLVGTSGNDSLVGGPGGDTLEGLAGDDTLVGSEGDDVLDGGAGSDTMDGGSGDDTYYSDGLAVLNLPGDVLIDSGGIDTLIMPYGTLPEGIENLIVRPDIDQGVPANGNSLDNLIRNESTFWVVFDGGGGNDTLIGGSGFDYFMLSAGNDSIDGGGGGDWLVGGSINFRTGTATLGAGTTVFVNITVGQGSFSSDSLIADDSGRTLHGDAGNDTVAGGSGADVLFGDGGFDHPDTNTGNDVVTGGAGNDFLQGGSGIDTLDGGAGNDTLRGAGDNDETDEADRFQFTVAPGSANADLISDFISATDKIVLDGNAHANIGTSGNFAAGDTRFFAGAGASSGHDADDRVIYNTSSGELWYDADGSGTGAAQLIATLQGAPTLAATDIAVVNGSAPSGSINGTEGNDLLFGTTGNDTIYGYGGNDYIQAGAGADTVIGGAGNDTVGGNDGSDWLEGGLGNDALNGGSGQDHFVFREMGTNNADLVSRFASDWDDIHLDSAAFANVGALGQFGSGDARFYAAAGASGGHDGDDRVIYDTSTGHLYYDADGSGSGDAQLVATLVGAPSLAATDITVI